MANILVNIEKGIEIGAEDALKWLTGANKALTAAPAVVAALATLIGAVEKPMAELARRSRQPPEHPSGHPNRNRPEGRLARRQGISQYVGRQVLKPNKTGRPNSGAAHSNHTLPAGH